MMPEIYLELKTWQTAIGSMLGFVALVFGALYNFRLNRKRDRLIRGEEISAIAAALYAEMLVMRGHIGRAGNGVAARYEAHGVGRYRGKEPFDASFRETFPLPPAQVYPNLMKKIGLLDADALLATVQFYENYQQFSYWLPKLEGDEKRGFTFGVLQALGPAQDAFSALEIALPRLAALAGVSNLPSKYDISKLTNVADFEEEMWEEIRETQKSS